jgi:hypothetical protein
LFDYLQVPFSKDIDQRNVGPIRAYLECINIAYMIF